MNQHRREEIETFISDKTNSIIGCEPSSEKDYLDMLDEFRDEFREKFLGRLNAKRKQFSKWITDNRKIMKAISKTRFEDIFTFIWRNTIQLAKSRQLAEERNIGKYQTTIKTGDNAGKEIERDYVLFVADNEKMEAMIGLDIRTIRKYFKKFCAIGIMREMGKSGSRGNKIYAVGYWTFYLDKNEEEKGQRQKFLKNTAELKKKLAAFKL